MKNKKIYGFVLLALIIMLLPIGMISAKYKQTKEVGSVTLDITAEPPILSANWKNKLEIYPTTLVVDSFTDENGINKYESLQWENGTSIGYDSKNANGFKNNVRLFVDDNTAYILAQGKNPVTLPKNSSQLFYGLNTRLSNIKTIKFNHVDTSNVTDMSSMFSNCLNLASLDVSRFNTSGVLNMYGMFSMCQNLLSLDICSFNTSYVTNMGNMFNYCQKLTSLNVSGFNTSSVTNMANMFNGCNSLTNLDVSNFDTSKVSNMTNMFSNCDKLTSLNLSNFNTSNVTDMSYMFYRCYFLTSLDLSSFNTSNVKNMQNMFESCKTLTSLDLSSFDTSNVTSMSGMFSGCNSLVTIYVSDDWNLIKVTTSSSMFEGCTRLKGGAGTPHSSSYIDKTYARIDGDDGKPGYLTRKETNTALNTFSLVQEGGTITGTKTTGN